MLHVYICMYPPLTTPKDRSCLTPHQHRNESNRIQFAWPQQAQIYKGSATLARPPLLAMPFTSSYLPPPPPLSRLLLSPFPSAAAAAAAHLFVLNIINIWLWFLCASSLSFLFSLPPLSLPTLLPSLPPPLLPPYCCCCCCALNFNCARKMPEKTLRMLLSSSSSFSCSCPRCCCCCCSPSAFVCL